MAVNLKLLYLSYSLFFYKFWIFLYKEFFFFNNIIDKCVGDINSISTIMAIYYIGINFMYCCSIAGIWYYIVYVNYTLYFIWTKIFHDCWSYTYNMFHTYNIHIIYRGVCIYLHVFHSGCIEKITTFYVYLIFFCELKISKNKQ